MLMNLVKSESEDEILLIGHGMSELVIWEKLLHRLSIPGDPIKSNRVCNY